MKEPGDEQFDDGLDGYVEITDIPEEDIVNRQPEWLRRRSQASILYVRRLSPRQRNVYLAATLGIVMLVVIIVVASSPTTRDALGTGIFGRAPTPTATLTPGLDLFYIEGVPSWSQVSIDGHRLIHIPLPGVGQSPVQLPHGHHMVAWHADPFQTQSCIISVPPVFATDTCHVNQVVRLHPGLSAWIISFDVSLAALPDDQRTVLVQRTQAVIQPGEQYTINNLTGGQLQETIMVVTATQPLRATLSFRLDAAPNSQQTCAADLLVQYCQSCRFFCPPPDFAPPGPSALRQWNVIALIYSTWTYTTLSGHVIAHNQFDSADHPLELSIIWNGTDWYVSVVFNNQVTSRDDLACLSAEEEIGSTGVYSVTGGINGDAPVNWNFSAGSNLAAGCLARGTPLNDTATSTTLPTAYLLDRFGVVLAANPASREYWSGMPVADEDQQRLAQQLAVRSPEQ
jgi:hypothetical protein